MKTQNALTLYHDGTEQVIHNPDNAALDSAIAAISTGHNFLRLNKSDTNYMQIAHNGGAYYVEFHHPDNGRYYASDLDATTASDTLQLFASDHDFIGELDWEPIIETSDTSSNDFDSASGQHHNKQSEDSDAEFMDALDDKFTFNNTNNPDNIRGYLGYYELADWWLSEFSEEQRHAIERTAYNSSYALNANDIARWLLADVNSETDVEYDYYNDPNSNVSLTTGNPAKVLLPSWGYLCALAEQIETPSLKLAVSRKAKSEADSHIIAVGGESLAAPLSHEYQTLMQIFHQYRTTDESALHNAIACAQQSIALAPLAWKQLNSMPRNAAPAHVGYKRLAGIYASKGRYEEAIQLCQEARDAGWNGDWDALIRKYTKRKENTQ